MNILPLLERFQTQDQAVAHLEKVRWHGRPVCPYCESEKIGRHASDDRLVQRWQCRSCARAFSATVGTIFQGTHVHLRNWFLVLALTLSAKKSVSAHQIAKDLGMRRPTVSGMLQRIRTTMDADPDQAHFIRELVEDLINPADNVQKHENKKALHVLDSSAHILRNTSTKQAVS